MTRKIFLLGGHDLEMLEIKKLLDEQGIRYVDKNLDWGNAKLKMYADEVEQYADSEAYTLYGIELHEDDFGTLPENYHRIDHHNAYSHLPSAIEQVCALLEIPMTRHQQLVAANDKAYIGGMKVMGATDVEIADIRFKDRQAQGVTPEDERMADEALKNKKQIDDLIVVNSQSSRFSPICDQLYPCDKLLIYNDNELVYYGKEKNKLVQLFTKGIDVGKMYHGGGDAGFIGTVKGKCEKVEIERIKDSVIEKINHL